MFDAVERLTGAVDALLDADFGALDRDALLDVTRCLEVQRRRLSGVDHAVVAELDERGTAHELAVRTTSCLLQQLLRLSASEAGRRVRTARQLGPRRTLSGGPLAPLRPHAAAAQRDGAMSEEQAKIVLHTLDQLPASTPPDVVDAAERDLIDYARDFAPKDLRTLAERLVDTINPDGRLPREDQQRLRFVRMLRNGDGSYELKGRLTPECGAACQAVISALGKPAAQEIRSPGQQTHDAMLEAARRLLGSDLPECNGVPTTVLLTMDIDQLESRTGVVTTAHGGTMTVDEALQLAVDGGVVPVVFNDTRGVLKYGRKRRFASLGQTYALYARDLRCTFPGCDQPAAWCHRDHVKEYRHGGDTDVASLQLLCDYHDLHARKRGWTPVMVNGTPHWKPPRFIDPDQRLRRNPQPEHDHKPK